jgi:hypothetical protein
MKKIFLLIPILFLIPFVYSQVITIGVSPSEFKLWGIGSSCFTMNFFNTHGDVDANYTVVADECMSPYITSQLNSVIVPVGGAYVQYQVCINGNFTQNKTCYIYIHGKPVGAESNGTINIDRRVGVRFLFGIAPTTTTTRTTTTTTSTTTTHKKSTTTTTTLSSGDIDGQNNITTTKKTTTTHPQTTQTTIHLQQVIPTTNGIQIIQQITTTTIKVESESGTGILNFLLNTTTGLYVLVALIVVIIAIIGMVITRKSQKNTYNPLHENNQGIYQFFENI